MTLSDPDISLRERRISMTEEEFFREIDGVCAEWVDGEAIIMSPVSIRHGVIVARLVGWASYCAGHHDAGSVFTEPVTCRLRLSKTKVRSPDVSFVSKARESILAEQTIDGPPDLVIEVVSSDSRTRDYREKFDEYEAAGVKEYWIVDPLYESIDLYRLTDGSFVSVSSGSQGFTSNVLPGFRFNAEWLKIGALPSLPELTALLQA